MIVGHSANIKQFELFDRLDKFDSEYSGLCLSWVVFNLKTPNVIDIDSKLKIDANKKSSCFLVNKLCEDKNCLVCEFFEYEPFVFIPIFNDNLFNLVLGHNYAFGNCI